MFTHMYRGCFIHGYCDKPLYRVQAYGIPPLREFKSYRAAQLAIAKAIKAHDAAMMIFVSKES